MTAEMIQYIKEMFELTEEEAKNINKSIEDMKVIVADMKGKLGNISLYIDKDKTDDVSYDLITTTMHDYLTEDPDEASIHLPADGSNLILTSESFNNLVMQIQKKRDELQNQA